MLAWCARTSAAHAVWSLELMFAEAIERDVWAGVAYFIIANYRFRFEVEVERKF